MAVPANNTATAAAPGASVSELLVPIGFVSVVVLMIFPIPPMLVDLLLATSIALSLMVLLIALYARKPLEFSTFPSVLLVLTLFRLGLNVASTRLILGRGAEGTDAAGEVIRAFGDFVVGGSYLVGLVIFLILVLINFVVITKGAGRIAEVAARFTLDAMPGKQLAVDAELNSGMLGEKEARARRRAIEQEADFYGAMDGASKFVRGDAIAGLMIAAVNIVGGLIIGVAQGGLGLAEAAQTYTTLTVGDGLVTQVPALLVSTAAGIIVTRAGSGTDLGSEVTKQVLFEPRVLTAVSISLGLFAIVPGLPFVPFVVLSGATAGLAWVARETQAKRDSEERAASEKADAGPERADATAAAAIVAPDLLELEVGYELVPLVDGRQAGELIERIRNLRRQLGGELGLAVPAVHIRDNLQLEPASYAILLKGVEIACGQVRMGCLLAIGATEDATGIAGVPAREPAFGLDALWIVAADRERAQMAGFTVVDPATVVVTHLTEVVRRHAHELIGRQEVQALLDGLARTHPKVVEELVPQQLTLGGVQRVLQNLLREGVSIRDLRSILETLADHAPTQKDAAVLTEHVRQALGRAIAARFLSKERTLPLMTLAPRLERELAEAIHRGDEATFLSLEPARAHLLVQQLAAAAERFALRGHQPLLLTSAGLRPHVRRFLERFLPGFAVISPAEVPTQVRIDSLGSVSLESAEAAGVGA